MASPSSRSNGLITCDLCENSAKKFCDSCQVSLCAKCVHKHVKKFKSQTHDIVHIKDRTALILPNCEFHSNQRCEAQCQQCDVPVCIKCIINSHNGHSITDMLKFFIGKKEEIREETQDIESSFLPMVEKKALFARINMAYRTEDFIDMEEAMVEHRKLWHQEVDIIFDKFSSTIKSMKYTYQGVMELNKSDLENMIQQIARTVQENKEILKSNKVSDVTNYKSQLMKYKNDYDRIDIDEPVLTLITNTSEDKRQERELFIELGEYKATMTQGPELFAKTRDIAIISTEDRYPCPLRVACVDDDKAWVSYFDYKTLKCVDLHGTVHKTFTPTCQVADFSVTSSDELIYIDSDNKTVNKVNQGETEVLITLPKDWQPKSLCCTSENIFVNLEKDGRNKIVSFQGQTVKQEIYKDKKNRKIFGRGCTSLSMAKNGNGDLCVADMDAGIVVVLKETGKVRFRYDGTPAMREEEFQPTHIVTNSSHQIIVGDFSHIDVINNGCLHILEMNGEFLRCVDNFGVHCCDDIIGLSADPENRLWIVVSGKIKVIQVFREECEL